MQQKLRIQWIDLTADQTAEQRINKPDETKGQENAKASVRDRKDTARESNMYNLKSYKERRNRNRVEAMFEQIMSEKLPEQIKDIQSQIQETVIA